MPAEYVKPRPGDRRVRDLAFGEIATTDHGNVTVDLQGKAWIDYDAKLCKKHRYFPTVDVRLEKGGCVVTLPPLEESKVTPFVQQRLDSAITTYLPVIAIAIDPLTSEDDEK